MQVGIEITSKPGTFATSPVRDDWEERALQRARLDIPRAVLDSRRQIVEVVAPAGYGKSTLLDAWARALAAEGRAIHRLLINGSHRDPVRFIGDLLNAISPPAERSEIKPVFSEAIGLDQLMSGLQADGAPKVIVLDDVHLLESSPAITTLNWICDQQPDQVLIILGAREYTGLPLQKRFVRKQLTRFGARELAFTLEETRTFLGHIYGLEIPQDILVKLHKQTEGWIAALQMAALAMDKRKDLATFVDNFGGSNREITDYLAEAVLNNLSPEDVNFLFHISVLDRINADISRALTGEKAPQLRLEAIERQNLFLLPLSDKRDWYRFHPLFGEFLRARFRAVDPDAWLDCLKRAESWSIQHDYRDDAINYALRGGLQERAAQILSIYAEELVQWRGEHRTLLAWIEQLSPRVLARYPLIQISLAWALNFDLRFAEASSTLDALLAEVQAGGGSPELFSSARKYQQVCEIVGHALADDATRTLALGAPWLEQNADANDFQLGSVCTSVGFALKSVGDFDGAHALAQRARQHFIRARAPYGVMWADVVYIITAIRQGHLKRALAKAEVSQRFSNEKLGAASHGSCMMSAFIAGLQYESNNLPAAREALSYGLRFLAQHSSIDPILVGYITLARLLAAEGRYADAKEVLIDGENLGLQRNAPRLVVYSMMWRGLILLREGDVAAAEELLRNPAMDGTLYGERNAGLVQDKSHQLQIRIAISRGNADAALTLLQPIIRRARQKGQLLKLVELLIQRVHALYLSGDENDALRTLSEALTIAAPESMIRAFVDEGQSLHPLLLALQRRETTAELETVAQAHLQNILNAIQLPTGSGFGKRSDHGTVLEPLTKRELQLLRMIDGGLSNRQLAQSLFVSEGTIKWHLHNLYGKLSVRSRSGAIAKARRLTLIG